jgi:hypothetical protein
MSKELVKSKSQNNNEDSSKKSSSNSKQKEDTKKQQEKATKKQQAKDNSKSKNTNDKNTNSESSEEQSAKKDTRNNNTRNAGLEFDVNTRYKWNKAYLGKDCFKVPVMKVYENSDKKKEKRQEKDEDGNLKFEHLRVTGAQYAHSSNEQVLCAHIVALACGRLDLDSKTKAKLYEIKHTLLAETIRQDAELNFVFGHYLNSFEPNGEYYAALKITKGNEVKNFVEKCVDNSSIHLTEEGLNFLYFIILRNRVMLTECSFHMVKHSGKKTVSEEAVMTAVEILYSRAPNLRDKLTMKFAAVARDVKEAKIKAKASREANKGNSKKKPAGKQSASKQASKKKEESEDEQSSDSDQGNESDDDN